MKRDLKIYLEDILESSDIIARYIKKVDYKKFSFNIDIQDKVLRRLSVIGEAAKLLPKSFKSKYPDIPWERITGMRNVIIHEYFGVEMERIWKVAKRDLPKLHSQIEKILEELEK